MAQQLADSVLRYVRGQDREFVALLERLVDAESPSDRPEAHRLVVSVICDALERLEFRIRLPGAAQGHRHLFARRRNRAPGRPCQLVLGHYDTVWPLGTTARRPFEVDGDIVRGPGVFDMKGGIAQLIVALGAIGHLGLEPAVEPVIFINADEETGSRTSTRYVTALAKVAERAFVLEPSLGEAGALKTERKGIGRFTVTVHGKAAHAGLDPEGGASAILELSHVIQALFALNDVERGVTVNVGTIDGGIKPNVIAPHSRAVVDVRVPTVADGERVSAAIRSLEPRTPGVRLVIEGEIGRPAMEQTPRNRRLWQKARDLGRELGIALCAERVGGASDGNTASLHTATLDGLGPVGHGAHADHEFLQVGRTLERAALLALLILAPPTGTTRT